MRKLSLLLFFVMALPAARLVAQDLKAYQNYDFVPGDKIIFEDDFKSDQDGEFPAHWKLDGGQAVVNKIQGEPAFLLTDGNYAVVAPRIKGAAYLTDPFTVEFDYYPKAGSFEKVVVFFRGTLQGDNKEVQVVVGDEVATQGLEHDLSGNFPGKPFQDKWHHAAIVCKGGQMKVYEDQYRVLVVPDVGDFKPQTIAFGGIGDANNPVIFKNVRVATGGDMNLIDKLTKEGRIVTHGILFDVNQATIKPQSQGSIAQIVKLMKDNPGLALEIGGHTDNTGDAAKNMTLSQQRADAVKKAIVDQGIDASRLTTKGYGSTKPIDSNDTPEGKANNRRVEFTKAGGA